MFLLVCPGPEASLRFAPCRPVLRQVPIFRRMAIPSHAQMAAVAAAGGAVGTPKAGDDAGNPTGIPRTEYRLPPCRKNSLDFKKKHL